MAQMYPATLPKHILGNRQLKGEIEVYEVLTKLPAGFEVFYNRCAQSGPFIEACERQVDFILLHEKYGMLCMEVKGGKVRMLQDGSFEQYHPSKKAWASIKPIEQVKNAWFKLLNTCKSDGVNYWIPEDCCVVLPKTSRHDLTEYPQSIPTGIFCADDLSILTTLLPRFLAQKQGRGEWKRSDFLDMRRRLSSGMPPAAISKSRNDAQNQKTKPRPVLGRRSVPLDKYDVLKHKTD